MAGLTMKNEQLLAENSLILAEIKTHKEDYEVFKVTVLAMFEEEKKTREAQ